MAKKVKVAVDDFEVTYEETDPACYLGHITQAEHDKAKAEDDELLSNTITLEVEAESDTPTVKEVESALMNYLSDKLRAGEATDVEVAEDGFEVVEE